MTVGSKYVTVGSKVHDCGKAKWGLLVHVNISHLSSILLFLVFVGSVNRAGGQVGEVQK